MKNKIIIGSRGSKLALIYAERARSEILRNSQIDSVEIKSITTIGDIITDVRVSEHGCTKTKRVYRESSLYRRVDTTIPSSFRR